jgi:hypothetical protein
MADPIVVGTQVKAVTGGSNVKMIGAYRLTGSTGLPYVMVNSANANYYQVPVGRKCIIISISFVGGSAGYGNNTVYIGSTANSTSGAHIALNAYASSIDGNNGASEAVKTYIEMEAGDYCNINVTRNPTMITMTAIEMDA